MGRVALLAGTMLATMLAWQPARPADPARYRIDEHVASIGFATRSFGLFAWHGSFGRFRGELAIDPADPARTAISITLDDSAVQMPWAPAGAILRSADFFDSARYPTVTFRSGEVALQSSGHLLVRGVLTIRGVARPQSLAATLLPVAGAAPGVAEVRATGELRRSEFGMVADPGLIGDRVSLTIRARIAIPPALLRKAVP